MEIVVKIGDFKVASHPDILVTRALGSCVAVCLYQKGKKMGGLCHIILPDSSIVRTDDYNPAKFADTGIRTMIEAMIRIGGQKEQFEAKVIGGASMFTNFSESLNIGAKNTNAAISILNQLNIPIVAKDTGEDFGRNVVFKLDTGAIEVSSFKRDMLMI